MVALNRFHSAVKKAYYWSDGLELAAKESSDLKQKLTIN
jgi:hypothetical protein